jgi:tetratricopeptide (TPR) repeat protein
MAETPNKLIRFWHELNRRGVLRVIATYAATSYIIIQVVNNLVGPLNMAPWVATMAIITLAFGFPVVIIFSWIFDLTPQGIKKTESIKTVGKRGTTKKAERRRLRTSDIVIAVLLVIVAVLAYPKIFNRNSLDSLRSSDGRISVAVMPFRNETGDSTRNSWQTYIQDNLIIFLSNYSEELVVSQIENTEELIKRDGINIATITPSVASTLSRKLDANVFIYGSINQLDTTIRISATLINSKTKAVIRSFPIDGTSANVQHNIDSLSVVVKNFLLVSNIQEKFSRDLKPYPTSNLEAYNYFIKANNASDVKTQMEFFKRAIDNDSNYVPAIIFLSMRFEYLRLYGDAKEWCLKAYNKRYQVSDKYRIMAEFHYARLFETPNEVIRCLKEYLKLDDGLPVVHGYLGIYYGLLKQFDKAIPEYEKTLEIYKKWKVKPSSGDYINLGDAYHKTGQQRKAREVYKKAQKDFPDNPIIIFNQTVLSLSEGDTIQANRYIEKYRFIGKGESWREAEIANTLAGIYEEAGILDRAEKYYRQSAFLEPEKPGWLVPLAYFLIDNNRSVNEGMDLIEKHLKSQPDSYYLLHIKGWGLYKQGKYKEALEVLQKSWDLRREQTVYDHTAYLHLEAAKKAVAGMKN